MSQTPRFDRHAPYLEVDVPRMQSMLSPLFEGARVQQLTLLEGGFANTNYKVEFENRGQPVVVRFPQRGVDHLRKEVAVLKMIHGRVSSPSPIATSFDAEEPFAVFEYVGGVPLSKHISELDAAAVGRSVARALATIHSFTLPHAGFFRADFSFEHVFDNFGQGYLDYIYSCLANPRMVSRLQPDISAAFTELLHENEDLVRSLPNTFSLIHCDYNPKNMLVERTNEGWQVTGVLDWEFTATGSPLVDIGNFLRFEEEMPTDLISAFNDEYQACTGQLPLNWRKAAHLLDLASMCSFLTSEEDKPNAFRTSRAVIEETLTKYRK